MHPNTPHVIARQRYRERLAEANALRPGRLARASSEPKLDASGPLARWLRFRLSRLSPLRLRILRGQAQPVDR
jgi:hypothetical protein